MYAHKDIKRLVRNMCLKPANLTITAPLPDTSYVLCTHNTKTVIITVVKNTISSPVLKVYGWEEMIAVEQTGGRGWTR